MADNPIIAREMRGRMRGNRALWVQFGYLGVLTVVILVTYLGYDLSHDAWRTGEVGRRLFSALCVAQGALVALIAPALAAGAITLEREQRTLDSLLVSPLSTGALLRGKLVAATLFMLLLLVAGVPLIAMTVLLGGVAPSEVVAVFAVHLANALLLAAVGLGWSLVCNTSAVATTVTYLTVALWLIVTSSLGPAETLGRMCPFAVSLPGDAAADWVASTLVILLLAAWALDVGICRARLLRDGQVSWRPRAWLALAYGLALARSGRGPADVAPGVLLLAVLAAAMLVPHDPVEDDAEPVRWWQCWRHASPSAPLFVMLLPLVALVAAPSLLADRPLAACAALVVIGSSLLVALLLVRVLSQAIGRRWPTVVTSLVALGVGHLVLSIATQEFRGASNLWYVLVCSPYAALMRLYPYGSHVASLPPARCAVLVNAVLAVGLGYVCWKQRRQAVA